MYGNRQGCSTAEGHHAAQWREVLPSVEWLKSGLETVRKAHPQRLTERLTAPVLRSLIGMEDGDAGNTNFSKQ